ncbi:MAG: SPOR domain-containing protein [Campylobacterales bacterium]|nr:SPOR domain-containing protein [Campylobacterales bacterium]
MEEKNELNDIILNKGGASAGSKKLLLAIATITLILIIVLVVMNSLKNNEVQKAPQAIVPPAPTAPTEIINDPLFEPVEVIQEGNESAKEEDLGQVAQKIKEESLQNTPVSQSVVRASTTPAPEPTTVTKTMVQSSPVAQVPVQKAITPKIVTEAVPVKVAKPTVKMIEAKSVTQEVKKVVQPTITPKVKAVATTPTKATEIKSETKAAPTASTSNSGGTFYVQVGSFTKEPNKALFDRLNASGMKYTTQKSGETSKILVGPFQGEKAVQDAIGNIRQNIEAKAFKTKG